MKWNNFAVPPIFFCIQVKKLKLKRLADSGDELYIVASTTEY